MTLKDSRMLWRSGGGSFERASLVVWRINPGRAGARCTGLGSIGLVSTGAGFGGEIGVSITLSTGFSIVISTAFSTTGVVLSRETSGGVADRSLPPPSNLAARDAVLSGRTVAFVEPEFLRVWSKGVRSRAGDSSCGPGDGGSLDGDRSSLDGDCESRDGDRSCEGEPGASPAFAVPAVFSHGGAFWEALLVVGGRSGAGDKALGVLDFSGELVGVEGRAVDGEPWRMEPGRPKGD
jgi:hypothetical protein